MTITPYVSPLDSLFAALASQKRRDIVHTLALRPATVKLLAEAHDMSLPAIHKHLRSMEEARLIIRKKVGRTNFVALNKSSLRLVQDWSSRYRTDWATTRRRWKITSPACANKPDIIYAASRRRHVN